MKKVRQESVELAFQTGVARNVVVVQRSEKEWYFTFEADDPLTGKPETFALLTQRGQLRLWADPRRLFTYLQEKFNVHSGAFSLKKEESHDGTEK